MISSEEEPFREAGQEIYGEVTDEQRSERSDAKSLEKLAGECSKQREWLLQRP